MKRIVKPPQASKEEVDKYYSHKFNITQFLFDKQLAFVEDPSPFKVAVCSRRSGKTTACAAHLVATAIGTSDINVLYITLTRDMVKRNIWKELRNINARHKLLGIENSAELTITFPNKSVIHLSGCNDRTEVEKFRGMPIKLCYIDECQSFRAYIEELIDDVISPALMDYAGSLCLIGTPGPVPAGYFHKCSEESEVWSRHYWTFFDNPHIPLKSGKTHKETLDREIRRRGVTVNDPSVQREFFGKWILDSDSLLIHYDKIKNHFTQLMPNIKYNYIMGVDVGFKDADALGILAWADEDPVTYLVEELITPKQGLTELVEQIQALQKKYNVAKIVMDMGGLGLKMGEEMIRRHSIPVEAAEKARKMENVEFLNDALRTGRFKAKSASRFVQDSYLVEVDRDKSTPDKIKISDRFHSDIIDAVLYAFKLSPAYSYEPPKQAPKFGSKEWAEQQSNDMFEAEMAGHQAENEFHRKLYGTD